jgi:hypothetical protein
MSLNPLEPSAPSSTDWKPVGVFGVGAAGAFAAYVAACFWFGDESWVPILDSANLAIHEAGHPIFGLLSERLAVYGGTLAQILFPAAFIFEFARRREALAAGFCGIWLGENLLNVARYMADARDQLLPLVGGPDVLHDWNVILGRWHLLQRDVALANGLRVIACLGIAAALAFVVVRWRQGADDGE